MRIDGYYSIKLILNVAMINAIVFILIEIVWAEIIAKIAERTDYALTLMIFGGFLLSMILSILMSYLGSESINDKNVIWISALISYLLNSILWIIISYLFVLRTYPDIISSVTGIQKFVVMPQVVKTFAIYILPNFTLLWLISGVTYVILYVIFLYAFNADIKRQYSNSKSKGTFW